MNHFRRIARVFCVLACCIACPQSTDADVWEWMNPELRTLREQTAQRNVDLASFGKMTLKGTTQEYGSQFHMFIEQPSVAPWTQLDLGYAREFDSITIVPVADHGRVGRSPTYAFPTSLRVDVSDDQEFTDFKRITEIADTSFEAKEGLPLVIRTPNTKARYIRITITQLTRLAERWTYALGEIIVLQGNRNIAADSQAMMSLSPKLAPKWHQSYLIDSRSALGLPIIVDLPAYDGVYCAPETPDAPNWMMLDFGEVREVDEIRLIPINARQGASVAGFGFPNRLRVEAFDDESLSDPITIFDSGNEPFSNPGDNAVVFPVPRIQARFIRVTCIEPSFVDRGRFGLSEFQVYSGNENIALTSTPIIPGEHDPDRRPDLLIDGYASYGKLMELPDWIDRWDGYRQIKIAIRDLRVQTDDALALAYTRGKLLAAGTLVFCVTAGLAWLIRRRHQQRVEKRQFRMRLARDLHDEIGSNLAAIARLGEIAELEPQPTEHSSDWQSVRHLALECTDSMRETLWLLGGPSDDAGDLPQRLRRAADRMLSHITVHWQQDEELPKFDENKELSREVFLIFKEMIANVAKHSQATQVNVSLRSLDSVLSLSVQDNGIGFEAVDSSGMGMSNMDQRTRKLGGTFYVESTPGFGTRIEARFSIP